MKNGLPFIRQPVFFIIARHRAVRSAHARRRTTTSSLLLFLLRLHLPLLDELLHIAHRHATGVFRIDLVEVLRDETQPVALRLRLRHRRAIAQHRIAAEPGVDALLRLLLQCRAECSR